MSYNIAPLLSLLSRDIYGNHNMQQATISCPSVILLTILDGTVYLEWKCHITSPQCFEFIKIQSVCTKGPTISVFLLELILLELKDKYSIHFMVTIEKKAMLVSTLLSLLSRDIYGNHNMQQATISCPSVILLTILDGTVYLEWKCHITSPQCFEFIKIQSVCTKGPTISVFLLELIIIYMFYRSEHTNLLINPGLHCVCFIEQFVERQGIKKTLVTKLSQLQ